MQLGIFPRGFPLLEATPDEEMEKIKELEASQMAQMGYSGPYLEIKHGWLENPRTEWRFLNRKITHEWSMFHVWLPEGINDFPMKTYENLHS